MKILILGGTGFIGKNLSFFLQSIGHDVFIFDRQAPNISNIKNKVPKKHFFQAEFHETEKIRSFFHQIKPEIVIHLISSLIPGTSLQNTIDDINENIVNTLRLLHLMQECNIKKIVFFSSGGTVYGNNQKDINKEDDNLYPINSYGWTKLAIEHLIRMQNFQYNINYIILRPANVYGKYQNLFGRQGLIATTMGKLIEKKDIEIWGDGSIIRDYVYVEDICQIVAKLIESEDGWNETYNIGTKQGTSINTILEKIILTTGIRVPIRYLPERIVDIPTNILNNSKILSRIEGFRFTDVEVGISKMWEWVKTEYALPTTSSKTLE
jgi:UDP-glucose 4-epimerase